MMSNQLNQPTFASQSLLSIAEYEQNIRENPQAVSNYWYLGLALLFQGREEEAQITWMTPFWELGEAESPAWLEELTTILLTAAQQQEAESNSQVAWAIRQHLREFIPEDINNLLQIIVLDIDLNIANLETDIQQLIAVTAESTETPVFEENLFVLVIEKLLHLQPVNPLPVVDELVAGFLPYLANSPSFLQLIKGKAEAYYRFSRQHISLYFAKIALKLEDSLENLSSIIANLQSLGRGYVKESVIWAEKYLARSQEPIDTVIGCQHLLESLLASCHSWEKAIATYAQYKQTLGDIVSSQTTSEKLVKVFSVGSFLLYLEDNPQENRLIRNNLAALCQQMLWSAFPEEVKNYQQRFRSPRPPLSERPLRIGYLSECFRSHSVGFLAWWLLKYHDRQEFDIYLYSLRDSSQDPLQQSYKQLFGERFYQECLSMVGMADKINQDEIDILVDLDSLTSYGSCSIVALKPAPIQVSWLGYDATGFPTVDYFIADDYVLPESAQDYYTEKIWRLPQNYIGIDGFVVGTPTISRESLNIPQDAVIYFSSQTGLKRNPHNIRLQMQIIKQVPQSYFILKSHRTNSQDLQDLIYPIAEAEGVDLQRLRFLDSTRTDTEHRANLAIADVVLDTYPYNGATTTLETLWMGIPLVTRVGEQFAARNSYTMMMNVGVTEGIAASDAEYVEWGVRLGKDEKLRQEIAWKLRKSRQTSPLWNGKQFTREMEKAYRQMWEIYVTQHSG
jgi:predicted O-linked N-acetylglucosamine transferase (SPINDLY family)